MEQGIREQLGAARRRARSGYEGFKVPGKVQDGEERGVVTNVVCEDEHTELKDITECENRGRGDLDRVVL